MILFFMGSGLAWFGWSVATKALYPSGRPVGGKWPFFDIVRSFPKWDQDRAVYYLGGIAMQFSGLLMMFAAIFKL